MPTMDFFSGRKNNPEDTSEHIITPVPQAARQQEEKDDLSAAPQALEMDFFQQEDPDDTGFSDSLFARIKQQKAEQRKSEAHRDVTPVPKVKQDRPNLPEQDADDGYAPVLFDFDHSEVESVRAHPTPVPPAAGAEEYLKKAAPAKTEPEQSGYTPISFDFDTGFDDAVKSFDFGIPEDAPQADNTAVPEAPAKPAAPAKTEPEQSGYTPISFDFDTGFDDAVKSFDFGIPEDAPQADNTAVPEAPAKPAAPAKTEPEQSGYTPISFDFDTGFDDAVKSFDFGIPEDAPQADNTAVPEAPAKPAAPAKTEPGQSGYAPISFDFGSSSDDVKSFVPEDKNEPVLNEEPTVAFTPVSAENKVLEYEPITEAAVKPAVPDRTAAPAAAPQKPAPRAGKENDIGAAVFSALMDAGAVQQPKEPRPEASAAPRPAVPAAGGWPDPGRPAYTPRTPQPIDWHALDRNPQPAPRVPQPAAKEPEPDMMPIDFDFDLNDEPDTTREFTPGDYTQQNTDPENFSGLFDLDPDVPDVHDDQSEAARREEIRERRAKRNSAPKARQNGNRGMFAWIALIVLALIIVFCFVFFGGKDKDGISDSSQNLPHENSQSGTPAEPGSDTAPEVVPAVPENVIPRDEWYMVLANRQSVLPADFAVAETVQVGEAKVDSRIAEPLKQMMAAAEKDGIQLKPVNGYRTMAWQKERWDSRVNKLMTEKNLTQAQAEEQAVNFTSAPGTSDHNTGLGVDIVSEDHPKKDGAFKDTPAAKWLADHAHEYGFILRYPADKVEQTGMDYEPWHYRYVSPEQAQKIKAENLCLEEYLQ